MATARQVTCIKKIDRNIRENRITHLGGFWNLNGTKKIIPSNEVIYDIENKLHSYYVLVGVNKAEVVVAKHGNTKYLRTESDSTTVDNLLSIPECS